ncbi:hypothetical protein MSAN_02331700 [Mycena sanguinolenta]|uniref:CxC2-like cysteine cluster KDZ transposase-associated domain-containing protein n=1 Tax=Mycena sanguinolenta TaxID=230812 RepID=A0A8H6X7G2_9AGAR|nr:hypothetical protein MSAN_02331700 [Mycena sanguinolenta]
MSIWPNCSGVTAAATLPAPAARDATPMSQLSAAETASGGELYCTECSVCWHENVPLHIVDLWDGTFFKRSSLKELGLHIQFGHAGCSSTLATSIASPWTFAAARVAVRWATMASSYYAADGFRPRMICPKLQQPSRVLDFFHMQTLQGKTMMFDFYTSLEKLTDVSGTSDAPPPKHYREFLRMTCAYRNLLMLKRAGRGYKLGGMSTCSGLAALDYANTKFSRGYSATGVGMGVCACHEFVQPNGVGDLQKGKRYANMDWIFSSIMQHKHPGLEKVVSYDIACQWWKKLVARLLELPGKMRLAIVLKLLHFAIPKMHIHSHTLACQLAFSLNYLLGASQTDGEGIERPWANIGGVASSTREMGLGSRRDILDDHWGFWNWTKLTTIGALLRRQLDNAKQELEAQTGAFQMFLAEQADRVPEWEAMAQAFDADPKTAKNPYEIKARHITEAEVKLKFAEEEQVSAARGVPSLHDVSPSSFIYAGLDLEEQQRRVRVQVELKKAGTTAQKINVLSMRRKLSRGITRFRKLQATYTPGALQALARIAPNPDELPEDTPLMLPSALSPAERESGCVAGVHLIEVLARDAQCSEALVRLRNQLHVKSRLLRYKEIQAWHQGANTRSRTLVARNESKIHLHSERYQAAWDTLHRLRPEGEMGWRQLRREDVRTMEDAEELSKRQAQRKKRDARRREKLKQLRRERQQVEDDGDGEGMGADNDDDDRERVVNAAENKRQVSWIWTTARSTGSDVELEDALWIEWTKARARCKRWAEEVALLEEEYRRVLKSFEHEARRWDVRARDAASAADAKLGQGKAALRAEAGGSGRGRKHIQVQNPHEPEPGEDGERVGEEAQEQRAEQLEAEESDSDAEEDDEQRGNVHSDEEFFMGGEAEAD